MPGHLQLDVVDPPIASAVLEHYIYSSCATQSLSHRDLQEMLVSFRAHNSSAGITGLLLYGESTFLQLFEGPCPVVHDLMLRIRRDSRHENLQLLSHGPIPERLFPNWSMGLKVMPDSPLRLHPGYSSVLEKCSKTQAPKDIHVPSWELLMMFREMVGPNL